MDRFDFGERADCLLSLSGELLRAPGGDGSNLRPAQRERRSDVAPARLSGCCLRNAARPPVPVSFGCVSLGGLANPADVRARAGCAFCAISICCGFFARSRARCCRATPMAGAPAAPEWRRRTLILKNGGNQEKNWQLVDERAPEGLSQRSLSIHI